jgi:aryl-alcohol dehydrogenase-like predicted oxidoreductase
MVQLETIKLAPDLEICKIINGMWQVAGGHGQIDSKLAISEMVKYHQAGFTSWDMADIYGPAEEFLGEFRKSLKPGELENNQAFTKFVPNPGPMTKSIVEYYIEKSIKRMKLVPLIFYSFTGGIILIQATLMHCIICQKCKMKEKSGILV